ncbi:MAG: hypothetical protein GTN38_00860 [Candidatus Aenigmarchaeota archaeon]|nr:hypothetical protein [Candidatus Aenigmarchaeota archaeon]NIP40137.1 hypothetical protein [Candidatus Aenigmarchaeota archaeon]NIQ18214.1 hypothetical protein [Candidatus Aenigmarchaeota archaeon]NIS72971.1 hypothetical protein [Candidatus Aenigmarchaeota archaeon]
MLRKGQMHLMEYVLLAFFILMVIFLIIFFLMGWNIGTTSSRQHALQQQRATFLLKTFSNSPYLNKEGFKEGGMLEDSKLTVLECSDLEELVGRGIFAEVKIIDSITECEQENYPRCGVWKFCSPGNKQFTAYDTPVNVYRTLTRDVEIGILTVGFYE